MFTVQNVLNVMREKTGELANVETHIKQTMQLSIDVASEVIERNQDGIPFDNKLAELQKLMSTYVELEADIVQFRSAVKEMCTDMTDVSEDSADLLREMYQRLRASVPNPESHTLYKDLMRTIAEGRNDVENVVPQSQEGEELDEDSGLLLTQDQDSIPTDPFTKREVTDPVRNKICKHVYEKASILQHINISRGRNLRCPIAGCSNMVRLTEDVLEEDDELRQLIRRKKRTVNLLT